MRRVFADTSYYGALLGPRDGLHEAAVRWLASHPCPILVTEFILLELANGCRLAHDRKLSWNLIAQVYADPDTTVIPASAELLRAGLELYGERLDKEWSLTDCISFVVMKQQGLTEALTEDRHFEQAGFSALLR